MYDFLYYALWYLGIGIAFLAILKFTYDYYIDNHFMKANFPDFEKINFNFLFCMITIIMWFIIILTVLFKRKQ
jgi:uncharacterized membrane protein YhaH (DUF805 family)